MFPFVFDDSQVKNSSLLYLSKLFWSSFWLSVLNRKQTENWLSKKNTNSFVRVLVNCFSPDTSDKASFDFYGRFVYVGSVLFWSFHCQLEQLHCCRNGASYCICCWIWCWIKFVISLTYPEGFSFSLAWVSKFWHPKNKIYFYLRYYFASQAMFLPFKPK